MKTEKLAKKCSRRWRQAFPDCKDFDPADTGNWGSEAEQVAEVLQKGIACTADLQDKLYAQGCWSLLLIFQAMDAAGKDGIIKHVMTGINPQGCQVFSFKAPSDRELQHDFLWRTTPPLFALLSGGISASSIARTTRKCWCCGVHPEILEESVKMPPALVGKNIWDERFEDIRCFERHMARSGTIIRKFFLHVSKKEQKRRFLARLDEPAKNWKFSAADVRERACWDDYQKAYEDMIRNTASGQAPWYIVPADNKWFTRIVVSAVVVEALESLGLAYPKVDEAKKKELEAAKKVLLSK